MSRSAPDDFASGVDWTGSPRTPAVARPLLETGLSMSGEAPRVILVGPPMAPPVELNRWLRDLRSRPYEFRRRAAGLHAFSSIRRKVPVELPLVLSPDGAVGGSLASVLALEEQLAASESLFPCPGDREFVMALHKELFSPAVRTFYFHMLPERRVLAPRAAAQVPRLDALFVRLAYPLWRRLMHKGLDLAAFDPEAAARAIDSSFATVERERGSRPFLSGEEPGIRDIVFAVLASPVLLPPQHPASIPEPAELPDVFRARLDAWRAHPAGQLALRIYESRPDPKDWGKVPSDRLTLRERISPVALRWLARLAAARGPRLVRIRQNALVPRYADVCDVLGRDGDFLIAPVNRNRIVGVMGPFILGMDNSPELQMQRAATYGALRSVDHQSAELLVGQEAERLVSAFGTRFGRIDVVNSYARPIAARAAVALFGIRGPSETDLLRATRAVFHETFLNLTGDKKTQEKGREAGEEIAQWIQAEAAHRTAGTATHGDLLDQLLAQVGAGRLEEQQVPWITAGLLVGAIDTTATVVANIMCEVATDSRLAKAMRHDADDPQRLRGWCWEALRRRPHNPLLLREAAAGAKIAGKPIAAGTRVWALTLAAMQDARVFPEPRRLRPDRPDELYLHFGAGLHRCSGRHLNGRHVPLLVRSLLLHGSHGPHDLRFRGPFPDRLVVQLERRN